MFNLDKIPTSEATSRIERLDLDELHVHSPHPESTGIMLRDSDNLVLVQFRPATRKNWWVLSFPRSVRQDSWTGAASTARKIWAPVIGHFGEKANPWGEQK